MVSDDEFLVIFSQPDIAWKERKRRGLELCQHLTGEHCDFEVFRLVLGRDDILKKKITLNFQQLSYICSNFYAVASKNIAMKKSEFIQELYDPALCSGLLRVLRLPMDWHIDHIKTKADPIVELPWRSTFYHVMNVIRHFVLIISASKMDLKTIDKIVKSDIIETCMPFADDEKDALVTYEAVNIISILVEKHQEACERFVFSGGIAKFGKFLRKDFCAKYFMWKWFGKGLADYQRMDLIPYLDVNMYGHSDIIQLPITPSLPDDTICGHIVDNLHFFMFRRASACIQKVCAVNDRMRKLVAHDVSLMDNLMHWFKWPCLVEQDTSRTHFCILAIGHLALTSDLSHKLVTDYGLIKVLECVLYSPDRERLDQYLHVLHVVTMHKNLHVKKKLLDSEPIMKALTLITNSFYKSLKVTAIKVLYHLSESPLADKILQYGFNLQHMIKLYDYHNWREICCLMHGIRVNLGIRSRQKMREEFRDVKDRRYRHYKGTSMTFKEKGNKAFKEGQYQSAITLYSQAIRHAPPSHRVACCESLHPERFLKCDEVTNDVSCDHSDTTKIPDDLWYPLPASVYANRAQCYLKTGDHTAALSDCNEAIARCLEDNDDAKSLLLKCVWRRSNALFELCKYERALQDICFCLQSKTNDANHAHFRRLYDKVVLKCRSSVKYDPIKRCSYCFRSEGMSLKRCGRCHELYCNGRCQKDSWITSHHMTCPGLTPEEIRQAKAVLIADEKNRNDCSKVDLG